MKSLKVLMFTLVFLYCTVMGYSVTTDSNGDYVFQTSGANYTINHTNGLIQQITDKINGLTYLNEQGIGLAFKDGVTNSWVNGVNSPSIATANLIINTDTVIELTQNLSNYNLTYHYSNENDYLKIIISLKLTNSSWVNASSELRYNWHFIESVYNNFNLTPSFSSDMNDISGIKTAKTIIRGSVRIGADGIYFFNATNGIVTNGLMFMVKSPYPIETAESSTALFDEFRSNPGGSIDFEYRLSQPVLNFSSSVHNSYNLTLGIDVGKDYQSSKKKIFEENNTINESLRGEWFVLNFQNYPTWSESSALTLVANNITNVELQNWYPEENDYLADGNWVMYGTSQSTNRSTLNGIINSLRDKGINTYIYINPSNLNYTRAQSYFGSAIVFNSSNSPRLNSDGLAFMDLSNTDYFNNVSNQVRQLLIIYENLTGLFVDRCEYHYGNYNYSSSIFPKYFNNLNNQTYKNIGDGFSFFLQNVSNYAHSIGKKLMINSVGSSQNVVYADITSMDGDDVRFWSNYKMGSLGKIVTQVPTGLETQRTRINSTIEYGIYMGWMLLSNFNNYPLTTTERLLMNYVANSNLVFFETSDSSIPKYVKYDNLITSQSTGWTINFNQPTSLFLLNNNSAVSNGFITSYNHTQYNDGLTDVILYSSDCVYPYEDMSITTSTTLCQGTYNLNDSNANGAIIIGANNVVLDCNGAELRGNGSANSKGVYNNGKYNVSISNCHFVNYTNGVSLSSFNSISNVFNNTFEGCNILSSGTTNGFTNDSFYNNSIDCWGKSLSGIDIRGANYTLVSQNNIKNCVKGISVSLNSRNLEILNNSIQNSTTNYGLSVADSFSISVKNNYVNYTDVCIFSSNNTNVNISGNTVENCQTLYDDFGVGIRVQKDSINTTVDNNNIHYLTCGILLRQSNFSNFRNNNFYQTSISDKLLLDKYDKYESTGAICVVKKYKGYFDSNYLASQNVTISGNTFDSNVQTFLRTQGVINLNHDLTGYWLNRFNVSDYSNQTDEDLFYNNNVFDYLSNVPLSTSTAENTIFYKSGIEASGASANSIFNYSLSKSIVRYWTNSLNMTISESSSLYHLINLSNNAYLKWYGNGLKVMTVINNTIQIRNCSLSYPFCQVWNGTSVTPQCENEDCNVSLSAGNRSLVLQYETSTQPKFTSIGTNINDVTYSLSGTTLTLTCSGSGSIGLTNMATLIGEFGRYTVMHDGNFVEYAYSNNYTISSCSTWSFYPSTAARANYSYAEGFMLFIACFMIIYGVISLLWTENSLVGFITISIGATIAVVILRTLL